MTKTKTRGPEWGCAPAAGRQKRKRRTQCANTPFKVARTMNRVKAPVLLP